MMGFSTRFAAGVWVGYHNRQIKMRGFMETMTQPILQGWLNRAHTGIKPVERERPSGIKTLPAYVVRKHVGVSSIEPSPSTDLFPSWYEARKVTTKKQTIDIVSEKLATSCTPDRAKKTTSNADVGSFSSDTFVAGGSSAASEEKDDIHKCDDEKPSIDGIAVTPNGASYEISVNFSKGTHSLSKGRFKFEINLTVDGKALKPTSIAINSGIAKYTYTPTSNGKKSIRVEIVDSVLYEDDASLIYTFNNGGGPP